MTIHQAPFEGAPKSASVPASLLLGWYDLEKTKAEAKASEVRRIMQTTPGAERDPDTALLAGRAEGAADVLRSLADYLIQITR
jgi:hypothetical protein